MNQENHSLRGKGIGTVMRVCLINPAWLFCTESDIVLSQNLGLGYLAGFLRGKGRHEIRFVYKSMYTYYFLLHQFAFFVGVVLFFWIGIKRGRRPEDGGQRSEAGGR